MSRVASLQPEELGDVPFALEELAPAYVEKMLTENIVGNDGSETVCEKLKLLEQHVRKSPSSATL